MAKQPTFKLYRICDKQTGKAFQCWQYYGKPYFTDLGAFFRTPETIRGHLRWLTYEKIREPKKDVHGVIIDGSFVERMGKNAVPDLVARYYVECYSVLQLNMWTQEASEYLGLKKEVA